MIEKGDIVVIIGISKRDAFYEVRDEFLYKRIVVDTVRYNKEHKDFSLSGNFVEGYLPKFYFGRISFFSVRLKLIKKRHLIYGNLVKTFMEVIRE